MTLICNHREKSGRLPLARVATLSATVVLLVGFSKPKVSGWQSQVTETPAILAAAPSQNAVGESGKQSETLISNQGADPTSIPALAPVDTAIPVKQKMASSRPFSFVKFSPLNSVLGTVQSRLWLPSSSYSPDKALREVNSSIRKRFLAVGFPDIRTNQNRSTVFDYRAVDPMAWYQLVAWRESSIEGNTIEPIAYVRCMGLSPQAVAKRADRYENLIHELANQYAMSASLIKAVITQESCFNKNALSPVGALGLMQLMPDTASWLKVRDPKNPEQNLRAGVKYLAKLREEFDTLELALAAYNAGPGNVRRYEGIPPFKETIGYVQKVQANYRRYAAATKIAQR